jgi:hypothetical protein
VIHGEGAIVKWFSYRSIVLMDELDQLMTTKQDVVYNFFNWPTLANSKLIVLAVANTMDLPERAMTGKVRSRLGLKLSSLCIQAGLWRLDLPQEWHALISGRTSENSLNQSSTHVWRLLPKVLTMKQLWWSRMPSNSLLLVFPLSAGMLDVC